jgi:hypothetical protein
MSMDNFHPDLIFDLAAGLLPEDEARVAEAALSAEGRSELAAQRAVLAAIADAPPVAMTDIERAHLHRSVAAAVAATTLELSPAAIASRPITASRRRSARWMRWASAAAVAATFIGVVAVGSQLGGGGSDSSADTVVSAGADLTSTTVAAAGGLAATDPTSLAGAESAGGSDPGANDRFLAEEARLLPEAPALNGTDGSDLAAMSTFLQDLQRTSLDPITDLTALPCYAVAVEDDDLAIVDGFTVTYPGPNGQPLDGIGYADAGTDTVDPIIRIYDLATCEPVFVSTD